MMGFFSKWKRETEEKLAQVEKLDIDGTKPYFYLTMNAYGGPAQSLEKLRAKIPGVIPDEATDDINEQGGIVTVASNTVKPELEEYQDGVLCTFWAASRFEAAGAVMAFVTISDDLIQTNLMANVATQVAHLKLDGDARDAEEANQVYEFTKSDEELVIALPTADDDGEFEFSGCYVSVESPRRTDAEATQIVIQGSNVLYATSSLPSMMSSMHRDISGVYGVVLDGSGPAEDIDGDDDSDWYS